jgi:uncharacterized membrane protein (UPF0127 family)
VKAPAFLVPLLGPHADSCRLVGEDGRTIAAHVRGAFDSASRRKGLLGRTGLADGEAIVIAPCNAVHMFFMKFAIDVVYVGRDGRVVKVRPNLRPWRISAAWGAFAAIELAAGAAGRVGVEKGQRLAAV